MPSIAYLLISQGVHVAHNLGSHLASLCDAVLKGALNDGHDQSQGRSVNEVNELGGQQLLQTQGGALGRLLQCLQQDGHDGCKQITVFLTWRSPTVHTSSSSCNTPALQDRHNGCKQSTVYILHGGQPQLTHHHHQSMNLNTK